MNVFALFGGEQTLKTPVVEKWQRPREVEKKVISQLIDRDQLTGSGYGIGKEFEKAFAEYIGCKYCLSFNTGTAALMAAYYAEGVGPGDEVITPAIGYIASYSGAMHLGARPVLCDINSKTLLLDPEEVKKKITSKTKAINIIHLNGRICNLDDFLKISEEHSIPIIDDASHAHGGEWDGRKIGNFEHITCFSLQGVNPTGKPVGAGEAGVACTNDLGRYQKMLAYCHLHRKGLMEELIGSPYEHWDQEVLGLKWRAHPLAMAIGLVSLATLDDRNKKLRQNYLRTQEVLKEFDFISFPQLDEKAKMAGFFQGIKIIYHPDKLNRVPSTLAAAIINREGIPILGPKLGYREYHRHIMQLGFDLWGRGRGPINGPWQGLDAFKVYGDEDFPIAEDLNSRVFSLPCYIQVDDVYYDALHRAFDKLHKNHETLANVKLK